MRIFFSDFKQRVVGKAYFLLRYLVCKDLELRMFNGNLFKHAQPVFGLEKRLVRTKGSMVGRAKEEGLEISLNDCLLGQREMPVMDGVEAATEKTDSGLMG